MDWQNQISKPVHVCIHAPLADGLKSHILIEVSIVTGRGRSLRRTVTGLVMVVDPASEALESSSSSSSSRKCLDPDTERRLAMRGWKAVEPTASK